jgi:hypothetical protein
MQARKAGKTPPSNINGCAARLHHTGYGVLLEAAASEMLLVVLPQHDQSLIFACCDIVTSSVEKSWPVTLHCTATCATI